MILIVTLLAGFALTAGLLAMSARAVGSPRGRFWMGCVATLVVMGVGLVFSLIEPILPPAEASETFGFTIMILIVELVVIYVALRMIFKLSFGRAFAPFGLLVMWMIANVVFLLFVMRPYLVETFMMPAESMAPTLEPGTRFAVSKLINPQRFDIVAYHSPEDGTSYVKRLIALPGETLRFVDGGITIDGKTVAVPPVLAGRCHATPPGGEPFARYQENEPITLGPDEYFFVGDNIDISADSRFEGPSDRSSIIGVVDLIYYPLGAIRVLR